MKNIYNDLLSAYYEMKNQKISICNDINELIAKRQQLEQDMTRIEYVLAEYGTYQLVCPLVLPIIDEHKAESEG